MIKNRTHPRYDAVIPVRFSSGEAFLVEYSENISMGGVFIRTNERLEKGTIVNLSFELPGTKTAIPVTGHVAFVLSQEEAAKEGKSPGVGVRFGRLDSKTDEFLRRFIESLAQTSAGRVLLVDGDAASRTHAAEVLRAQGITVVTSSTAARALDAVKYGGFDLILAEIHMSLMDGFELLDKLRSDPKAASIPFVFLTASTSDDDRKTAEKLGARHILPKPVDPAALAALVGSLIPAKTAGV